MHIMSTKCGIHRSAAEKTESPKRGMAWWPHKKIENYIVNVCFHSVLDGSISISGVYIICYYIEHTICIFGRYKNIYFTRIAMLSGTRL